MPPYDRTVRIPVYLDHSHAVLIRRAAQRAGMSTSAACRAAAIAWARAYLSLPPLPERRPHHASTDPI